MDIDRKIEEKKRRLLKTIVEGKTEGKKVKFGTVLSERACKMIEAICVAEDKMKSEVVEEAIREYFKSRWESYDETTRNFLMAKFGNLID